MNINVTSETTATVLRLEGAFISEHDQVALRDHVVRLIGNNITQLVIDLSGVDYINSCGLGALVSILAKLRKVGGDLRIANLRANVAKVVTLTGLDVLFEVHPDVSSALSRIGIPVFAIR